MKTQNFNFFVCLPVFFTEEGGKVERALGEEIGYHSHHYRARMFVLFWLMLTVPRGGEYSTFQMLQ